MAGLDQEVAGRGQRFGCPRHSHRKILRLERSSKLSMIYTDDHAPHPPRAPDPELHVPGRRSDAAVRTRRRPGGRRRAGGLRHGVRDGPLLPAADARRTPTRRCSSPTRCSAALAARTERVRLGTLVTGVTYRQPALLAKAVTALDVISKGRALLGIGAAWFDAEHAALGFEFPPLRVRYEHLVDALEICRGMFTQHATTYEGTHHTVKDAFNSPAPIDRHPDPDRRSGRAEDVPASPPSTRTSSTPPPTSPTSRASSTRSRATSTPWDAIAATSP